MTDAGLVALCAARSVPKDGDVYLDDAQHGALSLKFWRDNFEMHGAALPEPPRDEYTAAMDAEESNNAGREWWDKEYADVPARAALSAETGTAT
jgi:hypothetical protein